MQTLQGYPNLIQQFHRLGHTAIMAIQIPNGAALSPQNVPQGTNGFFPLFRDNRFRKGCRFTGTPASARNSSPGRYSHINYATFCINRRRIPDCRYKRATTFEGDAA